MIAHHKSWETLVTQDTDKIIKGSDRADSKVKLYAETRSAMALYRVLVIGGFCGLLNPTGRKLTDMYWLERESNSYVIDSTATRCKSIADTMVLLVLNMQARTKG
jgi:hypothetical protein